MTVMPRLPRKEHPLSNNTYSTKESRLFLVKDTSMMKEMDQHPLMMKEMDQFHRQSCSTQMFVLKMTQTKPRRAQQALIFVGEKHNGSVKEAQCVLNGKPTREWLVSTEDWSSPTAALESIILTGVINA